MLVIRTFFISLDEGIAILATNGKFTASNVLYLANGIKFRRSRVIRIARTAY